MKASVESAPYLHAQLKLMTQQKRTAAELLGTLSLLERRRLNASHALDHELREVALEVLSNGCDPAHGQGAACNRTV